ncbi:hypothetical protein K1719_037628 [Acacia pycnantha]|nr:hypothetical protein K1719_037628 [Acacia pycnantha]
MKDELSTQHQEVLRRRGLTHLQRFDSDCDDDYQSVPDAMEVVSTDRCRKLCDLSEACKSSNVQNISSDDNDSHCKRDGSIIMNEVNQRVP